MSRDCWVAREQAGGKIHPLLASMAQLGDIKEAQWRGLSHTPASQCQGKGCPLDLRQMPICRAPALDPQWQAPSSSCHNRLPLFLTNKKAGNL